MIQTIKEFIYNVAALIASVLPDSPFQSFYDAIGEIPGLGYLNYFVPVSEMIVILESWLAAIAVFYMYQIILRWVRMIQ